MNNMRESLIYPLYYVKKELGVANDKSNVSLTSLHLHRLELFLFPSAIFVDCIH